MLLTLVDPVFVTVTTTMAGAPAEIVAVGAETSNLTDGLKPAFPLYNNIEPLKYAENQRYAFAFAVAVKVTV